MARTLIELCQDLTARIGLPRPENIISGEGELPPQYLGLLYETAKDLSRRHDWQVLERQASFTTVSGETQATIPVAWPDLRRVKNRTMINTTKVRRLTPINATQHAAIRLNNVPNLGFYYRVSGNTLLLPNNADSGDSISFEYISNYWCTSADGATRKAIPTSDADIILLDDEALILGTKWRWKKENSLGYGEDFNDYEKLVQELIGSDVEREAFSLGAKLDNALVEQRYEFVVPST